MCSCCEQVGTQTVLVPFGGSTGVDGSFFTGATTVDVAVQQLACGSVYLSGFDYVLQSATATLPSALIGQVGAAVHRARWQSMRQRTKACVWDSAGGCQEPHI